MIGGRSLFSKLLGSLRRAPNTFLYVLLSGIVLPGPVLTRAPKPVQDVSRATLDNGLRVVIIHSSLAPVVTTVVNYLVGSNEAPRGFPGTAHAVEHMMFRGSPDLSADQLANIAAAMGGEFNADTQQSVTRFFFTVPKQDLDVALHIESIRMRNLLVTDVLWDQERGAIEQEVAGDLSNPEYVFYTQLLSAMFRGTPYEHDALGTRPSFDATTGAMLKKFHETWYAPNNAILVIAGDVDPAATMAGVKDLFAAIPAKTLPARQQVQLEPVKPETLHLTTDLPYGLAVAAFRWPGSNSPDFAAAQVLADVLGSQRSSLYDLVPQGKALSAGFSFDSLPQASLGYAQATFPAGGDGTALLSQVREVLEDIAKNGVPADLVNAAKRHEVADAEFQKNSISDLAMLWSEALALEGRQSPSDDIEAIQKVTVEDVREIARRLLNPEESISAILTPQPSGQPISSASFGGAESFAATENAAVPLPVWAQKVNQLSIPVSTVHPKITTLSNGLKLIVQPETVSDTISVFGYIGMILIWRSPMVKKVSIRYWMSCFPMALCRWIASRFKKHWTISAPTSPLAWIFHSKCLPMISIAASLCSPRMNYIRLCPLARSKSSSVSLPIAWRENLRVPPILRNRPCNRRCCRKPILICATPRPAVVPRYPLPTYAIITSAFFDPTLLR